MEILHMPVSSAEGPDFICLGMPKSGTGWLADQLKFHPDFWMPPVKEFAYLLRPIPQLKSTEKQFEKIRKDPERNISAGWSNRHTGDTRDYKFLEEAYGAIGKPMDLEAYVRLFRYKEGMLSGDISTNYCELNADTIYRVAERLPSVKLLLLVRDPIERAWSHVSMWYRAGKFDRALLDRPSAFRTMLEQTASFMRTSFPTKVVKAWSRSAPQLPFRSFLMDDIRETPDAVRAEILKYLDADSIAESGELAAGHNKKASLEKLHLSEGVREQLIALFKEEVLECADLFGGRAQQWPARYGL